MEKLYISSLEQLKNWNANPTKDAPYVIDWFFDWFFDELIVNKKDNLAIEARDTMIEFTMICENLTREQATTRTDENLGYYYGYGSTRWTHFKKLFPKILHPILGKI